MGKTKKIIKRLALLGIPLIFILFGGIIAITSVFVAIAGGGSSAKEANIESSMVGLPSIITSDMVIGSIEAHEKYGVYASVTLAQIILESGGDYPGGLSALAYECHNLFGMKGEGLNLIRSLKSASLLCILGYLITSLSPIPLLALAGCAICGFSVGLMWPGTFSLGATYLKGGGTFMYAMFALAGDIGCSAGPGVVGIISQFTGKMNLGIFTAILFPVCLLVLMSLLKHQKPA